MGLAGFEYDLGALTNLLGKGLCVLRETNGEERQTQREIKTRTKIWKIRLLGKKREDLRKLEKEEAVKKKVERER